MFWADSSTSTIGKRRDPCRGFGARQPIGLLPGGRAYRKTRLSPSPPSRARRRLVQPRHTPHTLQVWLRTSAERHETERQTRARFLPDAVDGSLPQTAFATSMASSAVKSLAGPSTTTSTAGSLYRAWGYLSDRTIPGQAVL